jgi:hypothetical protein
MARKMTIVSDDEALHTAVTATAARSQRPAKDMVAGARTVFLEATIAGHNGMLRRPRCAGESPIDRSLREPGLARGEGLPGR